MRLHGGTVLGALSVAAVVVFGSIAALSVPGTGVPLVRTTTVESVKGLDLVATLNVTSVSGNHRVMVTVQEFNPSTQPVNVSKGQSWASPDLRMTPCYASVFPFGVALYAGRYDSGNVTGAKPLSIFPFVACPLLFRLITGYYFEPQSHDAVVLPASQGTPTAMLANKTITGYYSADSQQATPLPKGIYTVEVGDEWGAVSFLYFEVG